MTENVQMSGMLDRRGMLGFWSKRKCVLKNNVFSIFKDSTEEYSVPITGTTHVSLYDQTGPRFILQPEGQDEIHLRAPDNERAMAWILALRSCGFEHDRMSIDNFRLLAVIGRGFYGKVTLARKNDTGELFAIKSVHKRRLLQSNKVHTVLAERNCLAEVHHPFIVQLYYAFQSKSKFYLVLEYVRGGELFFRMQQQRPGLPVDEVRLYIAEIALALKHLHGIGVIYRDLKAENVLLDVQGHVKLTDFGLSKDLHSEELTSTFCGTNEYLAPEVVAHNPYGVAVDWWTVGILMYEMLYGKTPFFCPNKAQMFNRILRSEVPFPVSGDKNAESLICGLLEKDPSKRFGFEQLSQHPFFEGMSFNDVLEKKIQPRFVPKPKEIEELTNFDDGNFNDEQNLDSLASPVLGSAEQVKGFSFDANAAQALQSPIDAMGPDHHVGFV